MNNRTLNEVRKIADDIENLWALSISEKELLESVLENIFWKPKVEKIEQLDYLLNEDTTSLLGTLYQRDVESYAVDEFELMSASDESDLVDALENLNYDFMDAVDADDMIEYLEDRGYCVSDDKEDNLDIITQSDLDELVSNFLSADYVKRKLMLKL